MSQSEADQYYDELLHDMESEDEDESVWTLHCNREKRTWLKEHFDVLQELYHQFREAGTCVFGGAFFQLGGFHSFVEFVFQHTIEGSDLLKQHTGGHVSTMAPWSGGERWLHGIPTASDRRASGSCCKGVGIWDRAVGSQTTGRVVYEGDQERTALHSGHTEHALQ